MKEKEVETMMELLGIQEVTSKRQKKNGTREFELPIKYAWGGKKIRVASFKSGYVRVQNCGYTAYQLNKRVESEPDYYVLANGDYRKYTTRTCKLILAEPYRLEYLLKYCIKNYYIKNANQVANGDFVAKWQHEYELKQTKTQSINDVSVNVNGQRYKVI